MIPWRKFAFFISLVQRKFSEWKKGSSCESQGLSVWGRCNCMNENQIDTNFPEEASRELTVWFPLITRSTGFVPQHRAWGQSLYADWWHCRRVRCQIAQSSCDVCQLRTFLDLLLKESHSSPSKYVAQAAFPSKQLPLGDDYKTFLCFGLLSFFLSYLYRYSLDVSISIMFYLVVYFLSCVWLFVTP